VVLSKRERYIAILTISVLGLLGLYQFVLQPLLDDRDSLDLQIATATRDWSDQNKLIKRSREARTELTAMTSSGKLAHDASEAETQIYRGVRDWATEARMAAPSVQPTRAAEKEKDFYKLTFRVQGSGSMWQISRFLQLVRGASIPVQITELQLSSNKENTDDLKLTLTVATIYLPGDSEKPRPPAGAPVARVSSASEVD
jgi:hypothetical protein